MRPSPGARSGAGEPGASALLLASLLALALAACIPPAARADGDPASDVLLIEPVFYPYQPPVSPALSGAMGAVLHEAARAGLKLKVAIVASREELGLDPQYYGHPQQYAEFLDREISFNNRQPLLVVMPAGFGTVAAGPPSALSGLQIDAGRRTYGLTSAAILAVVALLRASGHPATAPAIPPESSAGSGPPTLLLFGVPAILLILVGLAMIARSGFARERPR